MADITGMVQPEGFALVPSSLDLAKEDMRPVADTGRRDQRLRRALQRVHRDYDVVVIDCPPPLSLVTVNAVAAADGILSLDTMQNPPSIACSDSSARSTCSGSRVPGHRNWSGRHPHKRHPVKIVAWSRGVQRALVALPTGTGKTLIFAELIRRRGGRALVLAHREELLQQAAQKIRLVAPRAEIGLVRAELDEHRAPIVVASVATLARPERLRRVRRDFSMVTVDEAHHGAADSYRRVLEHVGATADGGGR